MFDRFEKTCLAVLITLLASCAHVPPTERAQRPFDFESDRLGFANETVWKYEDGKPSLRRDDGETDGERYTRRCFVVARASVQFWKFARFEPVGKPLDDRQLARRIREVAGRDVWRQALPEEKKVVIPGYANLREASAARPKIFQEHMGQGWPVYFRAGNIPVLIPPTRSSQEEVMREIQADLQQGYPTIVWILNSPSFAINHAVVVFDQKEKKGKITLSVYDPNYEREFRTLIYDPASRTFSYEKTFYFAGGPVDVRPLYRGYLQ